MLLDDDPFHCFLPYEAVAVPNAPEGPLSGLTLAVKDIFDVAGYRTGCGCPTKLAAAPIATQTAPAVQVLLDAGARFVGKVHTDELAWSMYGMNAHFGTPVNPAAPDRIPGGSSSGSAVAVSGGLADIALGSDTGGSVRAPASFCRVWGIRPTHGRASLDNVMELSASYDTPGLFARDAVTLLRASEVLYGPDNAPLPDAVDYLVADDMVSQLAEAPRGVFDAHFGAMNARSVMVYPEGVEAAFATSLATIGADAQKTVVPWVRASGAPLVHGIDGRVAAAEALTEAEIAPARSARAAFRAHMDALLGTSGVILAPAVADAPFRLDAPIEVFDNYRHVAQRLLCVAGLAGLPQVVFPAGEVDGAPYGLSLIGPRGSDLSLIALAARIAP